MESRELRIGNLFIEEHSGKIIKVIGLEEKRIVFSGMFLDKWQAKPIPLTEEILLKCGFEKFRESINWSDWKLGDYRFHFRPKKDCANCFGIQIAGSSGHNITYFNWNLKYLHQLQNLYFALTGEELEVKL